MKSLARALYRKLKSGRGDKLDNRGSYLRLARGLTRARDVDRAMQQAVGGEFEAVGLLELETLKYFGLREDDYVVDVGCGSGRLALPLSQYLKGRYLGIDIVPDLVDYARRTVGRDDWRFEVAEGFTIPERDGEADVVCFFSVLTHLLHEQSYVYLREARRVLKPGGIIVFSFLDFAVAGHWQVFETNIKDLNVNSHALNMFISKDAIGVWAGHLGLRVEAVKDADERFVPLSKPLVFESGAVMEKSGTIGQSVCVLRRD
ncbi:MAG TPA: class I SAM-dependent methyltransferase [Pyrinomonadaceae bacterium]|jgi:SAM-dependent methyltransferase|nr:class I SAM-dependent methyltransferase [Pyrinomonadaceae bacterium]